MDLLHGIQKFILDGNIKNFDESNNINQFQSDNNIIESAPTDLSFRFCTECLGIRRNY